jgi:hypothetical protein
VICGARAALLRTHSYGVHFPDTSRMPADLARGLLREQGSGSHAETSEGHYRGRDGNGQDALCC